MFVEAKKEETDEKKLRDKCLSIHLFYLSNLSIKNKNLTSLYEMRTLFPSL